MTRVFARGLEPYSARLRQYGFEGLGHVLDAGCGYGQWSLALARMNDQVTSIDVGAERLMFLDAAADALGVGNLGVARATATASGLDDVSVDAVFCYGVLFLTPWKEALAEFTRVLRPGGRLYVNANGLGWYKHLWYSAHNEVAGYDPQMIAATVLLNTLRYERGLPLEHGSNRLIEPSTLVAELDRLGYVDILKGGEGTQGVRPEDSVSFGPFFDAEYLGDVGVYEVLATRSAC